MRLKLKYVLDCADAVGGCPPHLEQGRTRKRLWNASALQTFMFYQSPRRTAARVVVVSPPVRPVGLHTFRCGYWGVLVLGGFEHPFVATDPTSTHVLVGAFAVGRRRSSRWHRCVVAFHLLPRTTLLLHASLAKLD